MTTPISVLGLREGALPSTPQQAFDLACETNVLVLPWTSDDDGGWAKAADAWTDRCVARLQAIVTVESDGPGASDFRVEFEAPGTRVFAGATLWEDMHKLMDPYASSGWDFEVDGGWDTHTLSAEQAAHLALESARLGLFAFSEEGSIEYERGAEAAARWLVVRETFTS